MRGIEQPDQISALLRGGDVANQGGQRVRTAQTVIGEDVVQLMVVEAGALDVVRRPGVIQPQRYSLIAAELVGVVIENAVAHFAGSP